MLFTTCFFKIDKAEATVEVVAPYQETLFKIAEHLNATVSVVGKDIHILKDGHTYIATDATGLQEIIKTLGAGSTGAAATSTLLTNCAQVVASVAVFYITYKSTIEIAKLLGFTSNEDLKSLNVYIQYKLKNPSEEVKNAIYELLYAFIVKKSAFDTSLKIFTFAKTWVKDFFDKNYKAGELNFTANFAMSYVDFYYTSPDQFFEENPTIGFVHNGHNSSHALKTNYKNGFYLLEKNAKSFTYYNYLTFGGWVGCIITDLGGYTLNDKGDLSPKFKYDINKTFKDFPSCEKGEYSANRALNDLYKINGIMLVPVFSKDIKSLIEDFEQDKIPDPPVITESDVENRHKAITDLPPNIGADNTPNFDIKDKNGNVVDPKDLDKIKDGISINPDPNFEPKDETGTGSDPGTGNDTGNDNDTGNGSDTGNGNDNGTGNDPDDKTVNWKKLKDIGVAFSNVFPFSIPWDFMRVFKGVFKDLKPTKIVLPYFIAGYDFSLTLDSKVFQAFSVIKILFRIFADIGLLLLVRKWMGAQK